MMEYSRRGNGPDGAESALDVEVNVFPLEGICKEVPGKEVPCPDAPCPEFVDTNGLERLGLEPGRLGSVSNPSIDDQEVIVWRNT
jgi:hypothetical protein